MASTFRRSRSIWYDAQSSNHLLKCDFYYAARQNRNIVYILIPFSYMDGYGTIHNACPSKLSSPTRALLFGCLIRLMVGEALLWKSLSWRCNNLPGGICQAWESSLPLSISISLFLSLSTRNMLHDNCFKCTHRELLQVHRNEMGRDRVYRFFFSLKNKRIPCTLFLTHPALHCDTQSIWAMQLNQQR